MNGFLVKITSIHGHAYQVIVNDCGARFHNFGISHARLIQHGIDPDNEKSWKGKVGRI